MKVMEGFFFIFFVIGFVSSRPKVVENDIDDSMESGNEIVTICQPQTPCAWTIYNYIDYPEITYINDYCVCRKGTSCEMYVNKSDGGYTEYRCKKKPNNNANTAQRKVQNKNQASHTES